MTLKFLTVEQIAEITKRHRLRDISYFSPSFDRHAKVGWRLYNAECGFYERTKT